MGARKVTRNTALLAAMCALPLFACAADVKWRGMGEVLAASKNTDWRDIEPANTLYVELNNGTVVIELAPLFAPQHVANLRKLLHAGYFRGASILRSQDNYVVQWSSDGPIGDAAEKLAAEFYRDAKGLNFTPLDSRDAYAAEVGFVDGFPVGRDGPDGRGWLTHCYGMLGAGRESELDSGNASELYVVTGHAPRHLDRNVTLMGRVIDGIEHMSSLPRGTGPLGFFESEDEYVPIRSIRLGTDYDTAWQALRTDTDTFRDLVASRTYRNEEWFADPAGKIELCNVPLPVRRME